jgi:hypothetical protein
MNDHQRQAWAAVGQSITRPAARATLLLFVDRKDVERGLGFQAAYDPEAAADQVVGEDAGIVVAVRDYVKVQDFSGGEDHAVVDPPGLPPAPMVSSVALGL